MFTRARRANAKLALVESASSFLAGAEPPYRFTQPAPVEIADLEIRTESREILREGGRVQLTARELEVLLVLVDQPDRVVTREAIYADVWGGDMPYRDRAADVYVRRVREKLRLLAPDCVYIHTHFGIGYRFWLEPPTDA